MTQYYSCWNQLSVGAFYPEPVSHVGTIYRRWPQEQGPYFMPTWNQLSYFPVRVEEALSP